MDTNLIEPPVSDARKAFEELLRQVETDPLRASLHSSMRDIAFEHIAEEAIDVVRFPLGRNPRPGQYPVNALNTAIIDNVEDHAELKRNGFFVEKTRVLVLHEPYDQEQIVYFETEGTMNGYAIRNAQFKHVIQTLVISKIEIQYNRDVLAAVSAKLGEIRSQQLVAA